MQIYSQKDFSVGRPLCLSYMYHYDTKHTFALIIFFPGANRSQGLNPGMDKFCFDIFTDPQLFIMEHIIGPAKQYEFQR